MTDLGDFEAFESDDASEGPGDRDRAADDAVDERDDAFEDLTVEPEGGDRGIGAIAVSEGLVISEEDDDCCLRAYVTSDNRSEVRLGTYLLVPYPDDERLFCRVCALEYAQEFRSDDATEIHARRAMRRREIDERDYKLVATLEPIAVLYAESEKRYSTERSAEPRSAESADGAERRSIDTDLKRRMPDRVPKPETVVTRATDTREIKTGLKMPDDGVFLGHLAVGGERVTTAAEPPTIDYRLEDDYAGGDPLVFRHTLVAGGTGSGKTHVAKNVLRQYLAEDRTYEMDDGRTVRPAVVQFDPQDEYAQMHDDGDATPEQRRRWEREGIAHGGHDDTIAFVPRIAGATYSAGHHRAEQVEFTIPFAMVRENPWLVAGGGLNYNQYNALTYLLDRFDGDTYDGFTSFLDDPALREELHEAGRVHEATYDALRRRVYGFDRVFDGDARPITDLVREFVRPSGLTVVPTYHINDTRATETVVLALASLLIDEKLSNDPTHDRIKETPLVLGVDEAHNFLTDADSVQAERVIGKFTEAAKQGRKERLGLFLVTQDPQDIAEPVFKQLNTKLVLNLGDEDAISAVNIPASLAGKVPYMEKGQMVVYSPDNSEPVELLGLSTCLTRHGRD